MFGTNESKTSPKSDALQTIAAPRQREEGDEHPGLHLGDPLLRLILLAAASRRSLFIVPFLIVGEEVGARADRWCDVTAGHGAPPCAAPAWMLRSCQRAGTRSGSGRTQTPRTRRGSTVAAAATPLGRTNRRRACSAGTRPMPSAPCP
jgi:hypothetical protein